MRDAADIGKMASHAAVALNAEPDQKIEAKTEEGQGKGKTRITHAFGGTSRQLVFFFGGGTSDVESCGGCEEYRTRNGEAINKHQDIVCERELQSNRTRSNPTGCSPDAQTHKQTGVRKWQPSEHHDTGWHRRLCV